MITNEKIVDTLKQCYDPEIPINIVDLGLIYDIQINKKDVQIKMTLTARGCPMSGFIAENVKQRINALEGVSRVVVEVVWDPPWTPDRIDPEARKILGM